MIAVLIAIALATAAGAAIVHVLAPDLGGFTRAGASILIGFGYIGLVLFVLSVTHAGWSRPVVVVALVAPLLLFRVGRKRSGERSESWLHHLVWIDALTLLLIVGHAIFAARAPMFEWDWFGIWGLKARTFFESGGIDWHFVRRTASHPDYPLLVPLMVDVPSLLRGLWEDRFVGLLYTALCGAFLLVARGLLAEDLESEWLASVGTLAIASPALNLWIGLAEGPVMAYGCAGLLLVRRGLHRSSPASFQTGAILLGLAAWCKNEGLALTGMAIVAIAVVAWRKIWRMWPAVAIAGTWLAIRGALHLHTDFMQGDVLGRVWVRLHGLPRFLRMLFVYAPDLRLFFIAAIVTLIVFAARAWRHERFLTVAVTLQALLMAVQALATRANIRAHIEFAWNRLPHQIAPALGYLAVVLLIPALGFRRAANDDSPAAAMPAHR